jgi:hypothetical protein
MLVPQATCCPDASCSQAPTGHSTYVCVFVPLVLHKHPEVRYSPNALKIADKL